jgi:hypothetical protein
LLGIAVVLLVLWRLHSLGMPSDLESLDTSTPVTATAADSNDERAANTDSNTDSDAGNESDATPTLNSVATFMGKPCPAGDCSVDLDGYHWAEEHGIKDPSACPDPSGEFVAGCRLYAGIEQKYNI